MRPWLSVAGTRCTRCTPASCLKTANAPSPLTAMVASRSPPGIGLGGGHQLHLQAARLGVAGVDVQEVAGEQRRLLAAGRRADLDEGVAVVVGVGLDQGLADLRLELRDLALGLVEQRAHVLVVALGQHVARLGDAAVGVGPAVGEGEGIGQVRPPPVDVGVARAVGAEVRVGQGLRELGARAHDLVDQRSCARAHGVTARPGVGACRRCLLRSRCCAGPACAGSARPGRRCRSASACRCRTGGSCCTPRP